MALGLKNKPTSGDRTILTHNGVRLNIRGKDIQVREKDSARGPGTLVTIKGATQEDLARIKKEVPGMDQHIIEGGWQETNTTRTIETKNDSNKS